MAGCARRGGRAATAAPCSISAAARGILALAALKLGAARAVGVDNDPQALLATHDNAERNGVGDRLERVPARTTNRRRTYPVVVANILASALDALADTLAARVAPGGRIALSGILAGQEDALLDALRPVVRRPGRRRRKVTGCASTACAAALTRVRGGVLE